MRVRDNVLFGSFDLLVVAVLAVGAFAVVQLPLPYEVVLQPLFVLPLLTFCPGYAVVAALFPARADTREATETRVSVDWYERLVLSVSLSLTIAVLTGIVLNYTAWSIVLVNVVTVIVGITVVSVIGGVIQQRQLHPTNRFAFRRDVLPNRRPSGFSSTRFQQIATPANLAVVVAVLITFGSIVAVTATPHDGETDTDFGLLTQNDDGPADAEGYPRQIAQGEQQNLIISIQNREQEPVNYTTVIQLDRVTEDGEVLRSDELTRFRKEVRHGETVRITHTVEPTYSGERLRLTYLLYKGDPPANPSVETAYREVHLWITVPESGAGENAS